jgi:hypothetical protein
VRITQWTESGSVAPIGSRRFIFLGQKTKANQATNTFAVRPGVCDRLAAGCANSCVFSLLRSRDAHAVRMR